MTTLSAVQSSCASESLNPLDRAIQRELAALATIEADHCSACRWLDEWSGPTEVKEHLACRLEARRRTEREKTAAPSAFQLADFVQVLWDPGLKRLGANPRESGRPGPDKIFLGRLTPIYG